MAVERPPNIGDPIVLVTDGGLQDTMPVVPIRSPIGLIR